MNDVAIMAKEFVVFFGISAGVTFALWVIRKYNRYKQLDALQKASELRVQHEKLKGEIDDSSLLDIIRRNNKRRGS